MRATATFRQSQRLVVAGVVLAWGGADRSVTYPLPAIGGAEIGEVGVRERCGF